MRNTTARSSQDIPPTPSNEPKCAQTLSPQQKNTKEKGLESPGITRKDQDLEGIQYCPGSTSLIPVTEPSYTENSFSSTDSQTLRITALSQGPKQMPTGKGSLRKQLSTTVIPVYLQLPECPSMPGYNTGEFKQFFFLHSLTLTITAVSGDLDGTLY